MDASELPTDVEQLKALLVSTLAAKERELKQARFEATQFKTRSNAVQTRSDAVQTRSQRTIFDRRRAGKKAVRSGTNDSGIAGCLTRQDSGAN